MKQPTKDELRELLREAGESVVYTHDDYHGTPECAACGACCASWVRFEHRDECLVLRIDDALGVER